jgi:D-glycero-D-manno-heptose 1,7-bisphosphate phosphatase
MKPRRAVFLDRDGVLNCSVVRDGKPYPPASADETIIIPGAAEALARLKGAGFLLLVVTNQPDIARGTQSRDAVDSIHRKLAAALPLDGFFVCYHDDVDRCECRKPLPGLLRQAAEIHGIDLPASFLIGDRWRDIDAGHAADCRTILIDYSYRERGPTAEPSARVRSLPEAVDCILRESAPRFPAPPRYTAGS